MVWHVYLQENSYMVFLYEGMAGRVQDFVTLRIGSLWLDVPLGPIQASNSASSLRTTAASPAMTGHEQEVNSAQQMTSLLLCLRLQSGEPEGLLQKQEM